MRRKTTDEFINDATKIHGDKYDYSLVVYVNSKKKVVIKCPKHGVFHQSPNGHLRNSGCNVCGYDNVSLKSFKTTDEFINDATKVHGAKYDYSQSEYNGASENIKINCETHGVFCQNSSSHIKGRGCPKCARLKQGLSQRSCTDNFVYKSKLIHGSLYDYDSVNYLNNITKVVITCGIHGAFNQTPADHLAGCGCPVCNCMGFNVTLRGTLYILLSECGGYMKIGITNNIRQRVKTLKWATPFKFNIYHKYCGDGRLIQSKEKQLHKLFKRVSLGNFDGYTEWFHYSHNINNYLEKT